MLVPEIGDESKNDASFSPANCFVGIIIEGHHHSIILLRNAE